MNKQFYISLIFLLFASLATAQEICDNGIDDDGDGLIDLNDDECDCPDFVPSGLIPNPSFEEMTCCPQGESQLNCAVSWIQASLATTDYFHTCGTTCHNFIGVCAPLPFPHGEAGIGFRDGKPSGSNFKEYTGACLTSPMKVGTDYTIDFFTGFPDRGRETSFEITLFATTNCSLLPFGGNNANVGCPLNSFGWVQLDQIELSGQDEWINTTFEFTADQEYAAIILGPGCNINSDWQNNPYFFFDRLILAESTEFGYPFAAIEGSICDSSLTLVMEDNPDFEFQWFKDGIAITGETSESLFVGFGDGTGIYKVVVTSGVGCFTSVEYELEEPVYMDFIETSICDGTSYEFGDNFYSQSGIYEDLFIATDGCDSIVTLDLSIIDHTSASIRDTICEGEFYMILNETLTEERTYEFLTTNALGCDSSISLELIVEEANEGLDLGNDQQITLGDELQLVPFQSDPDNVGFTWFSENNNNISNEFILSGYQPLTDQFVFLEAYDINGCLALDSVFVRVNRDIRLFVPNVFSPNNDANNDEFLAIGNQSVVGLEEVYIYDRWGNNIYFDGNKQISKGDPLFLWDGKFQGKDATEGVYVYLIIANIIDGTTEQVVGDVTLLR